MGKRILVFADGTGNQGGLLPDESRTNVYKLYRATRSGPDSPINPQEQLAFYVPGVGTSASSHASYWHVAKEMAQQAVGLGLKARIRACYRAIIGSWRPGDTIYLFGFSRGAYTARCVAHLLERFGIPSTDEVSLDPKQLDKVAGEAVDATYRFGLLIQNDSTRQRAIDRFRARYHPHLGRACGANAYFLGLWDTVAAYGFGRFWPGDYDKHLPHEIGYVRHALSIDENRKDFARVPLAGTNLRPKQPGEPDPLQQVWFAGNHADIGGSYPENESRLSDISLDWMTHFIATALPPDKRVDLNAGMLRTFPACDGIMHDECQSSRINWQQAQRTVPAEAMLHPTVLERLKLPEAREYGGYARYRPEQLRNHRETKAFFADTPAPGGVATSAQAEQKAAGAS